MQVLSMNGCSSQTNNTLYVLVRRNKEEPSPPSKHSAITECTVGERRTTVLGACSDCFGDLGIVFILIHIYNAPVVFLLAKSPTSLRSGSMSPR